MDNVEKPKPLPAGTYFGTIAKHELGESKEKKTPFVRLFCTVLSAGDEIDPSDLEGVELAKKQLRKDFYLTEDSLYRFKDFAESVGVSTAGRSLGEIIPDVNNASVMLDVIQKTSQSGDEIFNEIASIKGAG
jgi:hypothetical protein